jgi:hypothetical protein
MLSRYCRTTLCTPATAVERYANADPVWQTCRPG